MCFVVVIKTVLVNSSHSHQSLLSLISTLSQGPNFLMPLITFTYNGKQLGDWCRVGSYLECLVLGCVWTAWREGWGEREVEATPVLLLHYSQLQG